MPGIQSFWQVEGSVTSKVLFLLNIGFARLWVCVVVFSTRQVVSPSGRSRLSCSAFFFLVMFVFFLFISSQAHVAKLAVKK